jgi:hypothetical protein
MLTAAQQKVKQELEELKANGFHNSRSEEVVVKPTKTNSLMIITMVVFGLLILIFASIVLVYETPNQKKLNEYIIKEQEYYRESLILSATVFDGTFQLDRDRLKLIDTKHTELLQKVKKLPVPTRLKAHKEDFIRVLKQREAILSLYSAEKGMDPAQLNQFLLELDIKQELAKESLLKEFEREKVKYKPNEDGSIQYWINRESYQFSW